MNATPPSADPAMGRLHHPLPHSGLPTVAYQPEQPLYLRCGRWDPNSERSLNFAKGSIEAGLSVYAIDDHGRVIIPEQGEWAAADLQQRLRVQQPRWFVQGQRIGSGHDGEPLLHDVRVVANPPFPVPTL